MKRGEGKVIWINKEQKAVHWDRKRYHELLSKKESPSSHLFVVLLFLTKKGFLV